MSDVDVERRVADDPEAGPIPNGFREHVTPVLPGGEQQITLRLDPDVLRYFRGLGKVHQTRINAVLRRYVRAQKAG